MRTWFFTSMTLVAFVLHSSMLYAQKNTNVNFLYGIDFPTVKIKAHNEGKPIFIVFCANWSMPCLVLDDTTFQDVDLAKYIAEKYIAYSVDVDDFDGFGLKQQFGIKTLPTLLILNPESKVLGRYEGTMDAPQLMKILQELEGQKVVEKE